MATERRKQPRLDAAGWEAVPKSQGPIPGTHSYVDELLAGGGRGGDTYVEQLLTPYTQTRTATSSTELPEQAHNATQGEVDLGLAWSGLATGSKTAAEPRRSDEERLEPGQIRSLPPDVGTVETYEAPRTYRMSWEDYLALDNEKRAAVDMNTMLVQAREKDLTTEYETPGEEEKTAYDEAMRRLFGEDRGSETFAPATLAVLDRLDFKATANDDFDNILGGEYLVTDKELKQFTTEPRQSVMYADGDVAASGLVGSEQLAANTARVTEALAKGNAVLQNFRQVAAGAVNPTTARFGGEPAKVKQPKQTLGFGNTEDDGYFRGALEALSRTDFTDEQRAAVLDDLHAQLGPKNLLPDFMRYADAMTRDQSLYSQVTSWTEGAQYFRPGQVRSTLRLDRGGD